jgi:hypothetical protein
MIAPRNRTRGPGVAPRSTRHTLRIRLFILAAIAAIVALHFMILFNALALFDLLL